MHFLGELRRCAVLAIFMYRSTFRLLRFVRLALHPEKLNFWMCRAATNIAA